MALHLLRSIACSLFNLQSFCMTFVHVLFGLPLGLEISISYSYISSPSHCLLQLMPITLQPVLLQYWDYVIYFWISVISILGTLSLTLTSHIHLTILYSASWSAPCTILLCTQLLYSLPLIINDISLISNGTSCLKFNLLWIIEVIVSTCECCIIHPCTSQIIDLSNKVIIDSRLCIWCALCSPQWVPLDAQCLVTQSIHDRVTLTSARCILDMQIIVVILVLQQQSMQIKSVTLWFQFFTWLTLLLECPWKCLNLKVLNF